MRFVPINGTDGTSVVCAAAVVEAHEGRVDTLVNNAGVTGRTAPAVINVSSGMGATGLNGHRGTQTVTEGTDAIVTLATEDPSAGAGRFIDRFGPIP